MILIVLLILSTVVQGAVESKGRPFKVLNPPSEEKLRTAPVIFWDLDHTLYSKATGVYSDKLIIEYIVKELHMSGDEAQSLFKRYAVEYSGQVLQGLVDDFGVNPVQFEAWVDKAANLFEVLKPSQQVIQTLKNSKARNWIITNSGWHHANRVISALNLMPHIEAVIFLDYHSKEPPVLKPLPQAFFNAMRYAEVPSPERCYLIDDIQSNVFGACLIGWKAAHFCEPFFCVIEPTRLFRRNAGDNCSHPPRLSSIPEINALYPELFVS